MAPESIRTLMQTLELDAWRKGSPFSRDILKASRLLLDPFSEDEDRAVAMNDWLLAYQPCIFGRIAAQGKQFGIHYCFLTERDLFGPDDEISAKVHEARRRWKRRASRLVWQDLPETAFMLVAISPRLLMAAPDNNLKRLARRLRELAGLVPEADPEGNDITSECVYLRNPSNDQIYRFSIFVDYFGAQGDRRWWHDHRVPGGIAFTANPVGYMARYREWYLKMPPNQDLWALGAAMATIDDAPGRGAPPRSTWLRGLRNGKPLAAVPCPFTAGSRWIQKDWTRYEGRLYGDHSIRDEFFQVGPAPRPGGPKYLQDIGYLVDTTDAAADGHGPFMVGTPISLAEVERELGPASEWRKRGGAPARTLRPVEEERRLRKDLSDFSRECRKAAGKIPKDLR